ncbi:hypothetical protein ACHAWF_016994, partial [Thalassiosira exigua]
CTGPVLVSDARDVIFQKDPFGIGAPEVKSLQVFQEYRTQKTDHWIVNVPVQTCKGVDFSKPPLLSSMLCSGTTIGTRAAMLEYLNIIYEEMMQWSKDPKCCRNEMNVDDQAIHNYLFYTNQLPASTVTVPNRMGIVNTVGVQGSFIFQSHVEMWTEECLTHPQALKEPYQGAEGHQWIGKEFDLIDDDGFFTDFNGERSRVVHQIDRFGMPFEKYLSEHGGPQDNHIG